MSLIGVASEKLHATKLFTRDECKSLFSGHARQCHKISNSWACGLYLLHVADRDEVKAGRNQLGDDSRLSRARTPRWGIAATRSHWTPPPAPAEPG